MNARRLLSTSTVSGVLAACVLALAVAAGHVSGQVPQAGLQVLTRAGSRTLPIINSASQELVALDDLASAFQLAVRDDGGAITVGYKGKSIVLTPDQTIASVAGRLISLPVAPTRAGNRWVVPLDFISRALAPIYDARLDLRRASHLLVVGDLRVPRVGVRTDSTPSSVRVMFDITPAAGAAVTQQGNRLLVRVDADALDASIPASPANGITQAVHGLDATNLAIELGPRFTTFRSTTQPIDGGARLIVDLAGTPVETTAAPPAAPTPATPADAPAVLPQAPTIRTVVVDAGHGGEDAGAKGAGGLVEKDLTLAVARRLKSALEGRLGVRVVMTREDDHLVPIENRSAVANNNKADVFISLHANASFRPEVAGASTYVAAFADTDLANEGRAPERLPVFGGGLRTIEMVPWNLAQIPHRAQSEQLAQLAVESLTGRVAMAPRPIEHAPLRVLEAANMPAILLEMGYLSNAAQETALAGADTQSAIAQAIVDALVRFRDVIAAGPEGVGR